MTLGNGTPSTAQLCFKLVQDSTGTLIGGPLCTNANGIGSGANFNNNPLPAAGIYDLDVFELNSGAATYAISLEGLSPAPADGIQSVLNVPVNGIITPPTAQDAFTFCPNATSTYRLTISVPSSDQACLNTYDSTGALIAGPLCTNANGIGSSASEDIEPATTGTHVNTVYSADQDETVHSYSLEIACDAGTCPVSCQKVPPPPVCSDVLSYSSTTRTLTMNFTVGTPAAAKWDAWLVDLNENRLAPLSGFPQSLPITNKAKAVKVTTSLNPAGVIGVLTTFTTPTGGITCSGFPKIGTGTP